MPRLKRIAVTVPEENRVLFETAAKRLNISLSSFAGLLMSIGYRQILDNPEILTKVMKNES